MVFWLSFVGGVLDATTFFYITVGALAIPLIGAERALVCVLIGATRVGLLIFLHIVVAPPRETSYPPGPQTFLVNVLGASSILFVIVFYAVRQFTRAEERASASTSALRVC